MNCSLLIAWPLIDGKIMHLSEDVVTFAAIGSGFLKAESMTYNF